MPLNLNEIEKQLDAELAKETTESLTNWINKKRMEDNKSLIGRKMKGFRFEGAGTGTLKNEGRIGTIDEIKDYTVLVRFGHGSRYGYPLDQVHEHLIPEQTEEEKTHAADSIRMRLGFVDEKVKPLGKEEVQRFIDEFESFNEQSHELHLYGSCAIESMERQKYDPEAIEEAIDLLNDHIKGAEHFTSYPQDFLRGTAPGTNRDIKELISISERHKQKSERLKKVVEYLEQLKYNQITIK